MEDAFSLDDVSVEEEIRAKKDIYRKSNDFKER
jgi:hypothetical protein